MEFIDFFVELKIMQDLWGEKIDLARISRFIKEEVKGSDLE